MRMKRTAFLVLVLLLVCVCASALAVWYVKTPNGKSVNIRGTNNEVVGQIPYGESVIADSGKSTEISAFVEYRGVSGYVKWSYLVSERPEKFKKSSSEMKGEVSGSVIVYGEGQHSVSINGGVLQLQNKKKKATGAKYTEVKYDEPISLVATASIPKKKKIDYWVVNGAKLQLKSKSIGILAEDGDITVEVVFK